MQIFPHVPDNAIFNIRTSFSNVEVYKNTNVLIVPMLFVLLLT